MNELQPIMLLTGYQRGLFPMAESRHSLTHHWYRPEVRGLLPIADFHAGRNLRRLIRHTEYRIKVDSCFRRVMQACAERPETWISDGLIEAYTRLHELGYAHSVEVWESDELTGGLYGVSMGGAFFGESMFQWKKDRAKLALEACSRRLHERGFLLWDTQYYTEHLGTFGGYTLPRKAYERQLAEALRIPTWFGEKPPLPVPPYEERDPRT